MDPNTQNTLPIPEKKVGFARPTLIIPPPSASNQQPGNERKPSYYVFDQINELRHLTVNTAKSSLGFGEKCAYWLYRKVKVLSKKWFTHCFLTIILIIYTIGGAISFKTIEGPHEGTVTELDIRSARYELIEEVTELSRLMPSENETEKWMELANDRMNKFFGQVIENRQIQAYIIANRGNTKWTIWNSVVFCATIYTTIGENMTKNTHSSDYIEDLPANPVSDVVKKNTRPRRRRNRSITKREATPVRYFEDTSFGEGLDVAKEHIQDVSSEDFDSSSEVNKSLSSQGSFKKIRENNISTPTKKESISESAQHELISLFNKTKKSLTSAAIRGRERFRKYEQQLAKRSQSAPQELKDEHQETVKKEKHLSSIPIRTRKYSDSSVNATEAFFDSNPVFTAPRRKTHTKNVTASKIIEILDRKTSAVITRRNITNSSKCKAEHLGPLEVVSLLDIYRKYTLHKKQCKSEYDNIKSKMRKCVCELFLIMVFCGFGGLLFKFTEGTFETFYKCGVKRVKRDFIDMLWIKSHSLREDDWKSLARNKLRIFEEELHTAHEAGMTDYSGQRSWSFLNGIVYSLTIITTIGYGHMYPKTHTGRALSIVYALIGIPLFLIALTDFGKLFTRCIKFFWSFVRRLYYTGSCKRVRRTAAAGELFKGAQIVYDIATFRRPSMFQNTQNSTESESQAPTETPTSPAISNFEIDDEFNLPISVALFILVSYIVWGAFMYMAIEKWDFFTSFYFVFISMSTIGFGDYYPRNPIFMIGSIIYLVFGLALMSMCINVVQAKLSDTFKKASAKIGTTMGLQVDEDGSIITATPENVEAGPDFVANNNKLINEGN